MKKLIEQTLVFDNYLQKPQAFRIILISLTALFGLAVSWITIPGTKLLLDSDMMHYFAAASDLEKLTYIRPIGYSLALRPIFAIFGSSEKLALICNYAFFFLSVFIFALWIKELTNRWGALLFVVLFSTTMELINLPHVMMTDSIQFLTLAVNFYLIQRWKKLNFWQCAGLGLLFGYTAIMRGVLLLIPFSLMALTMLFVHKIQDIIKKSAIVFAFMTIPLVGTGLFNKIYHDKFMMLPAYAGINYYAGNNPSADGIWCIYSPLPEKYKNLPIPKNDRFVVAANDFRKANPAKVRQLNALRIDAWYALFSKPRQREMFLKKLENYPFIKSDLILKTGMPILFVFLLISLIRFQPAVGLPEKIGGVLTALSLLIYFVTDLFFPQFILANVCFYLTLGCLGFFSATSLYQIYRDKRFGEGLSEDKKQLIIRFMIPVGFYLYGAVHCFYFIVRHRYRWPVIALSILLIALVIGDLIGMFKQKRIYHQRLKNLLFG